MIMIINKFYFNLMYIELRQVLYYVSLSFCVSRSSLKLILYFDLYIMIGYLFIMTYVNFA